VPISPKNIILSRKIALRYIHLCTFNLGFTI